MPNDQSYSWLLTLCIMYIGYAMYTIIRQKTWWISTTSLDNTILRTFIDSNISYPSRVVIKQFQICLRQFMFNISSSSTKTFQVIKPPRCQPTNAAPGAMSLAHNQISNLKRVTENAL